MPTLPHTHTNIDKSGVGSIFYYQGRSNLSTTLPRQKLTTFGGGGEQKQNKTRTGFICAGAVVRKTTLVNDGKLRARTATRMSPLCLASWRRQGLSHVKRHVIRHVMCRRCVPKGGKNPRKSAWRRIFLLSATASRTWARLESPLETLRHRARGGVRRPSYDLRYAGLVLWRGMPAAKRLVPSGGRHSLDALPKR